MTKTHTKPSSDASTSVQIPLGQPSSKLWFLKQQQQQYQDTHMANPFTFQRSQSEDVTMATGAGSTLVSRRPSSHGLAPLRIVPAPRDAFGNPTGPGGGVEAWGEGEDVEEGGKQLFTNFVHDQVAAESPEAVRDIDILTPYGYANPMWAKAGRELRHMADIFANTAERRRVKQKASEVSTNISYEEFKDLLAELFASGGITKERIVVLFYFCSDVAIRSLKRGSELCRQFLSWSLAFVTDMVCSWVRARGGWGEVMGSSFSSLPRVLLLAGALALGFGVITYIRRR